MMADEAGKRTRSRHFYVLYTRSNLNRLKNKCAIACQKTDCLKVSLTLKIKISIFHLFFNIKTKINPPENLYLVTCFTRKKKYFFQFLIYLLLFFFFILKYKNHDWYFKISRIMILQTNAVEIYISNINIHRFESICKWESYSLTKNIYIIHQ